MVDSKDFYPPEKVTVLTTDEDYDIEAEEAYWKRIIELGRNRAILMTEEVIPYKKYIRTVVELSTIWEINRWKDWRSDFYLEFFNDELITPRPKRNRFMPWLVILTGVAVLYYCFSPLFK